MIKNNAVDTLPDEIKTSDTKLLTENAKRVYS